MSKRALQEQGKFIGSKAPFGYSLDPNDCHKLIINEAEAIIVREMFTRAADGELISSIRNDIANRENSILKSSQSSYTRMLRKEVYKGTLVSRTKVSAFSEGMGIKCKNVPESEWLRFENAVPAIVSSELWEKAQAAIDERAAKVGKLKNKAPKGSDVP